MQIFPHISFPIVEFFLRLAIYTLRMNQFHVVQPMKFHVLSWRVNVDKRMSLKIVFCTKPRLSLEYVNDDAWSIVMQRLARRQCTTCEHTSASCGSKSSVVNRGNCSTRGGSTRPEDAEGFNRCGLFRKFNRFSLGKCRQQGKPYNALPDKFNSTKLEHWFKCNGIIPVKPQSAKLWKTRTKTRMVSRPLKIAISKHELSENWTTRTNSLQNTNFL